MLDLKKPTPARLAAEFSDAVQKAFHESLKRVVEEPNLLPYVEAHLDKLLEVAAFNAISLTRQPADRDMLRRFCIKAGEAFTRMGAFLEQQREQPPPVKA